MADETIHTEIKSKIYAVGAQDAERRLFDELIPLPEGTSYNAYVVKGTEKTALLDTVDPTKTHELLANLEALGVDRIDYIVAHHAEQDHSGSLGAVLERFPNAKVVTSLRCKNMLIDLLGVDGNDFLDAADGALLPLGDKTLQFVYTPWVHWPETMCTYIPEDKILFSCDFFGSHLAHSGPFVDDWGLVLGPAKRYYAEIMMPFRRQIRRNLEKIEDLDIEMIAPSHGPVHIEPGLILDSYRDWVSETVANEVVLAYVSMHGSTRRMVEHLEQALALRGIEVKTFDLVTADVGELAMALVDAATIILASPTLLTGLHPAAAYAAFLVNALRPKARFAAVIGSYGWGGKMVDQAKQMLSSLRVELLGPVLTQGFPGPGDFEALDQLADEIRTRHDQFGIAG